jgi:hypothetical protein
MCTIDDKLALTTRSKSCKQVAVINLNNKVFTWNWLTEDAPDALNLDNSYAIVKHTFIENNELAVAKWRTLQQVMFLHLPVHFFYSQSTLGSSVGFIIHTFVS